MTRFHAADINNASQASVFSHVFLHCANAAGRLRRHGRHPWAQHQRRGWIWCKSHPHRRIARTRARTARTSRAHCSLRRAASPLPLPGLCTRLLACGCLSASVERAQLIFPFAFLRGVRRRVFTDAVYFIRCALSLGVDACCHACAPLASRITVFRAHHIRARAGCFRGARLRDTASTRAPVCVSRAVRGHRAQ